MCAHRCVCNTIQLKNVDLHIRNIHSVPLLFLIQERSQKRGEIQKMASKINNPSKSETQTPQKAAAGEHAQHQTVSDQTYVRSSVQGTEDTS